MDLPLRTSRPPRARHAVVLGLAAVSPASSVFVALVPVAAALGAASVPAFLLTIPVAVLVAMSYARVSANIPVNGGESAWATKALGPVAAAGVFVLAMTTLSLVLALFLEAAASLVLPTAPRAPAIALVGAALTLVAGAGLRLAVWLSLLCLALEVAVLGAVTLQTLRLPGPGDLAGVVRSCAHTGVDQTSLATLLTVPVVLFALNGYGQTAYVVEEVVDGARRTATIIYTTLALTIVLEGVPLAVLGCATTVGRLTLSSDQPLLDLLEATAHAKWQAESIRWAIAVALLNAILAVLIYGSRMLAAFAAGRQRSIALRRSSRADRPGESRRATAVVGAAVVLIAITTPTSALITATGSSLLFIYSAVAACAIAISTRARPGSASSQVAPVLLLATMGVMITHALVTDPVSVGVALVLLATGSTWFWLWISAPRPPSSGQGERQG
ncbi:APC family permease [Nocardioides sp.]|uniref:APC family permease n=1 Tax=Nocardioides sp. TaxID=35761 RepID=UPI003D0CC15B